MYRDTVNVRCSLSVSPPVHLHVLTVEEEHCGWYKRYIEISGVNRHAVDVNNVDSCHLGNGVLIFGQLKRPTAIVIEMFHRNRRTGAEH